MRLGCWGGGGAGSWGIRVGDDAGVGIRGETGDEDEDAGFVVAAACETDVAAAEKENSSMDVVESHVSSEVGCGGATSETEEDAYPGTAQDSCCCCCSCWP